MKILSSILFIILLSCSYFHKTEEKKPVEEPLIDKLRAAFELRKDYAKAELDPVHSWISMDCDGMIWQGKYVAATGDSGVSAAEYTDWEGRFGRRPPNPNWCYQDGQDLGSKTPWSGDMAYGLIIYAWFQKDLDILERHARYGRDNNWNLCAPESNDWRCWYKPALQGLLYQAIFALGGDDNVNRHWPDVYPSGLDDYEAALQMYSVLLRGEIDKSTDLLDIKAMMFERIKEHAKRQTRCGLYCYLNSLYSDGNYSDCIAELLSEPYPQCDYVRCDSGSGCFTAEWLFAASLILRKYDEPR